MKLIQAVVHQDDAKSVVDALIDRGFHATYSLCTGGFLGLSSVTVVSGVQEDQLEEALDVIKTHVEARRGVPRQSDEKEPVAVGGAVFVTDIVRFERL
jgi:uncharacterized protein YaaQ